MSIRTNLVDWDLLDRSTRHIAHGALTNSKRPESFVKGVYPAHLSYGSGCKVTDTRGNIYYDFICGLGTNLLGYGHPHVTAAVVKAIRNGPSLSLGTPDEVSLAEELSGAFQFADSWRFLKTGTEACMAAIKIARAATGRSVVISDGYHGYSDDFVSLTPPANGVPPRPWMEKYSASSLTALRNQNNAVAAIIVEPVITDISEKRLSELRLLREECTRNGTLLIFDEVITGFRLPKLSVTGMTGIIPDLIVLGKAMGNGFPISAIGGKHDLMNTDYFVSSTFAGELGGIAAAREVLRLLTTTEEYSLDRLSAKATRFCEQFNSLFKDPVLFLKPEVIIEGYGVRGVFVGEPLPKALFFQEAVKAGLLFGPSFFFNFCHIEYTDTILNILSDVAMKIKTKSVELEGNLPVTPFAMKQRGQS